MSAANLNSLIERAGAMKSPEIAAVIPAVEALPFEDRLALVRKVHAKLSDVVKHWDNFAGMQAAHGMTEHDLGAKAKHVKDDLGRLALGLALSDLAIFPEDRRVEAEAAFNIVAAWLKNDQEMIEIAYSWPSYNEEDIGMIRLGNDIEERNLIRRNDYVDGPMKARRAESDEAIDILDASGKSRVLH